MVSVQQRYNHPTYLIEHRFHDVVARCRWAKGSHSAAEQPRLPRQPMPFDGRPGHHRRPNSDSPPSKPQVSPPSRSTTTRRTVRHAIDSCQNGTLLYVHRPPPRATRRPSSIRLPNLSSTSHDNVTHPCPASLRRGCGRAARPGVNPEARQLNSHTAPGPLT